MPGVRQLRTLLGADYRPMPVLDPREQNLRTLSSLGFPELTPVVGRRTIAPFFRAADRRSGVYLLRLSNDRFYIGLAVDVVRRFGQHARSSGDRIVGFSFQPMAQKAMVERERDLIQSAERLGVPLEQVVWKSEVYGDSDLDSVLTEQEYDAWFADPAAHFSLPLSTPIRYDAGRESRDKASFDKLASTQHADALIRILRSYARGCIPGARDTVHDFWAVSCFPTTNASTWPRVACVSAHVMETFVIGHEKSRPDAIWGFINVTASVIEDRYGTIAKARRTLAAYAIEPTQYRSAGHDQCGIHFRGIRAIEAILGQESVRTAAATLLLRVMRKGVTPYAKFHCSALDDVLLA